MTSLQQAQQAIDDARAALVAAVRAARADGRTWADIGAELGMSRQAAFKRFGEPTGPRAGERVRSRSIAAVPELTERVFALISAAEYTPLAELMHPRTAEELPVGVIAEAWRRALGEVGALQGCSGTRVELPRGGALDPQGTAVGTVVGVTTLEHEAGELQGRVAFDESHRVVGLLLVPVDHVGELPF